MDVKKLLHGMIDALDLPTITFKDLKTLGIRWCNAHLLRLEALGRFPKRYVLSDRTSAWTPRQIMHYLVCEVGLDCGVSQRFECEQWDDDSFETPHNLPSDSENGPYYGA